MTDAQRTIRLRKHQLLLVAVKDVYFVSRFNSRLTKRASGCWEYNRGLDTKGYGRISFKDVPLLTHRVAILLSGADLSYDDFACHKCDNPKCCNPTHLFAGTCADNYNDMVDKGRRRTIGSKTPVALCKFPKGENNHQAKLTETEVLSLRQEHESGVSQRKLAIKYSLSRSGVRAIVRRTNWKYLE